MKKLKGIYLVANPAMEQSELLSKLKEALEAGVALLQIWNNWPAGFTEKEKLAFIATITELAAPYQTPVLINQDWHLLPKSDLQGVHFDQIPQNWSAIKKSLPAQTMVGLTAGNNPEVIQWAHDQKLDYLSFCAMFPSPSVNDCEIVSAETVIQARKITDLPLFLSGGINLENLQKLKGLDFQGVAIISGIMNTAHPRERVREYLNTLKKMKI